MRDQLLQMLQLKDVDRTGWVRAGVNKPESVAAHSWGMATLALKLCPKELDLSRVFLPRRSIALVAVNFYDGAITESGAVLIIMPVGVIRVRRMGVVD